MGDAVALHARCINAGGRAVPKNGVAYFHFIAGHAFGVVEALGRLRGGARPSVILLDLMMPIMNGWQFRYEQRQDSDLAKIPVVVVSAKSDSQQHALWLEADGYVSKPIDVNALLDALSHCCDGGHSDS